MILKCSRYNITPDGDLVIRDVSYTDVGTYQCYAKNKFGEKSAFGSLTVKSEYLAFKSLVRQNTVRDKFDAMEHSSCIATHT